MEKVYKIVVVVSIAVSVVVLGMFAIDAIYETKVQQQNEAALVR